MSTPAGRRMLAVLQWVRDHPGTSLTAAAKAAHPYRPARGRAAVQACQAAKYVRDAHEDIGGPRSLYLTGDGKAVLESRA